MSTKTQSATRRLVLSAMLLAIATVLSMIKIVDMPYGGSVTLASMLPVVIIAYRFGTPWGLVSGFVYSIIQMLLGLKNFSYVTGAASIIALALLDYLLAFTALGLGGIFRKKNGSQPAAFVAGSLLVALIRYLCHVISGATVWAGVSIPTAAALQYSAIYNATYMLPEMLVLVIIAYYLSSTIDFGADQLKTLKNVDKEPVARTLSIASGLVLAAAGVFDIAAIFAHLQDPESGEFALATGLAEVNWLWVVIVSVIAIAVALVLWLVKKKIVKK